MKVNFLVLLALILFITGCATSTTGNVIISEGADMPEMPADIAETTTTTIEEPGEMTDETVQGDENINITDTSADEQSNETIIPEPEIIGKLVIIENLKFAPNSLTIKKGETVTWQHKDKYIENMKHMLRIYPIGDASPVMLYGDIFSYTFNETKEYTIVDIIYVKKNIKMKIIVE